MNFKMMMFPHIVLLFALYSGSYGRKDIKCIDEQHIEYQITEETFGNIYSPGYTEGKPYPTPMGCSMGITAHAGKSIRLTFNHIDIALNPTCNDDQLIIGDGILLVGRYCGSIKVNDYLTMGSNVMLQFQGTPFGSGLGFNITYREVSETELCKAGEFECHSRKCIPELGVKCNGKDDCGDGTDEEDCGYPVVVPEKCGTPDIQPVTGSDIIDRIVGGREALRGSWPWQVDMQYSLIEPNGHICGGTLLNSQWFITAAHCIAPVRQMHRMIARIHLGNHHKYKADPYEQVRYMKEYFVYGVETEEFVITGQFDILNDLALVKLNAPVLMNPHVQVACLPDLNEEVKVGQKCFATGWGATRGSKSEDVLKQAEHPIQTAAKCKNDFQDFVNETMICAGRLEPLHGLCHGDSGGPLVCQKGGKWHVYGAASFITDTNFVEGICGIKNKPTVFAKISPKIDWIRSTISSNS